MATAGGLALLVHEEETLQYMILPFATRHMEYGVWKPDRAGCFQFFRWCFEGGFGGRVNWAR